VRSIHYKEVYKVAEEIGKNIQANDSRFQRWVYAITDDGSVFLYRNAFVIRVTRGLKWWYIIFSEHYETAIFHEDDISCFQFKPIPVEIICTK